MILAGFFDLGLGEAVKGISDASWRIVLTRAVERMAPSIILAECIGGAILSALAAAYIATKIFDADKEAMRDGRISIGEWILFSTRVLIGTPTILGLLWFGFLLAQASRSGLMELMK